MKMRLLTPLLIAMLSAGCDASGPQRPPLQFQLEVHRPVTAPATAATQHVATPMVDSITVPAPTPTPIVESGGSAAAPKAPAAPAVSSDGSFLILSDGRMVPLPDGNAVAVPEGLTGLATHFAPGRIPATVELAPGLTLHPRAKALAAEPSARVTVRGSVSPAEPDVSLYYVSADRRSFPAAVTAADGTFLLEVPIDGAERGVLVAKAGDRLAAAALLLEPGSAPALPPLSLGGPARSEGTIPQPPAGLAVMGAALMAVADGFEPSFRVPLAALTPAAVPPIYALPGFQLVHTYSAERQDHMAGSVTGAAPGEALPFLPPPDLATLPEAIAPGQSLRWPAVPGAGLYTVTLTSIGSTGPIWEAAVTQPSLSVPAALELPDRELVLSVKAWAAPDVTIYSVASARSLRVPATPGGPSGRHSWARHRLGPAAK